ncbi:MAG TPA: carotenoid biosynthesis protein [Candidatus Acidoferrales bacterium]|nr:carotenoid biosynthesis protein [Candidatus Acidoferrales bacterium]
MKQDANEAAESRSAVNLALWVLIAVYAGARVLQVFPGKVPMLAVVALHVLVPFVFALIHGGMLYRIRGILVFVAICLVVGNAFENVGVRSGFPFGRYYFTDLMGPKIFVVPVFLGLAYVGMAYLSWTLGRVILGGAWGPLAGARVMTAPLVAALIMVAWDFSMDPVWSTVLRGWIWVEGGAYFGVPVSNFLGWYLTVYVIFQCFAVYLRGREVSGARLGAGYWKMAIVFYAVSAAGNVLVAIPRPVVAVVTDASGAQWKVSEITVACALASIFIMGGFALLAWVRLRNYDAGSGGSPGSASGRFAAT